MNKGLIYTIFLCIVFGHTKAQTGKIIRSESKISKRYSADVSIAYINGYRSTINLLSILKPSEILIEPINSATRTSDTLKIKVTIHNQSHEVLRYLENKAKLEYLNEQYEHGLVPDINPANVSHLTYEESPTHVLVVHLYGEKSSDNRSVKFKSAPQKINFFDINGKLYTAEQMRSLNLVEGKFRNKEFISGREAVEKYGDAKYAVGVAIIETIDDK